MDELPRKTEAEKIVFFGKVKDKSKKKKEEIEKPKTRRLSHALNWSINAQANL